MPSPRSPDQTRAATNTIHARPVSVSLPSPTRPPRCDGLNRPHPSERAPSEIATKLHAHKPGPATRNRRQATSTQTRSGGLRLRPAGRASPRRSRSEWKRRSHPRRRTRSVRSTRVMPLSPLRSSAPCTSRRSLSRKAIVAPPAWIRQNRTVGLARIEQKHPLLLPRKSGSPLHLGVRETSWFRGIAW